MTEANSACTAYIVLKAHWTQNDSLYICFKMASLGLNLSSAENQAENKFRIARYFNAITKHCII